MKILHRMIATILCLLLLVPFEVLSVTEIDWDVSKETLLASLLEADISTIREAYDHNLITCTELTEYYLQRIDEYNDTYNCFITLCDDALEQAAQRDEAMAAGEGNGKLFGIPIVIKDNMDYAGYHTTNGYSKKSSQIANSNADVVEYLLQEGAIIIGKTNMSTGAQDARASYSQAAGETKNAYNSQLASGGSSGGSAAATSLNFATASLGTDTNSSLRLPAALNGCVSLRVTWDTLSLQGIKRLNSTRDVPGAITRTVKDQAIMLDVISGGTTSYADNLNIHALQGLRIGVLKELSYAIGGERNKSNMSDEVQDAFANAIRELEDCGAEVIDISIPNILSLASATLSTNKSSYKEKMYNVIKNKMEEENVSALIFPTYVTPPLRSGKDSNGKKWNVWNQVFINNTSKFSSCASLPEIAIPIGYHSRGAGIGMEIAALKNQEQLLLDIAYAYTERFDHRKAPEKAPDMYAEHAVGTLEQLIDQYGIAKAEYEKELRLEEAARLAEEEAKRHPPTEAVTEPTVEPITEPAAEPEATSPAVAEKEKQRQNQELIILITILTVLLFLLLTCVIILLIRIRNQRKKRKNSGQYVA